MLNWKCTVPVLEVCSIKYWKCVVSSIGSVLYAELEVYSMLYWKCVLCCR